MTLVAVRGRPLRGVAAISGDKSCSHRALILGALASGETLIQGLGQSDDVLATARALQAFGVAIDRREGVWAVRGGSWTSPGVAVDCGNSATTARLLMGAVAGMADIEAVFTGDTSLSRRPMRRVTEPLRRMGASVEGGNTLPIQVTGRELAGTRHDNRPASAQVKSALLLAGLAAAGPVRIVEQLPSRDHTEIMLEQFGVEVRMRDEDGGKAVELGSPRALIGTQVSIGADPSSAAFPLVAAAMVEGSEVTVEGMLVNPLRTGLFETLERMGADISLAKETRISGELVADVTMRSSWLEPCRVGQEEVPAMIDEIPALAVACAAVDGESVIEGLGELRHKESDRLGALLTGLAACGVAASVRGDTLHIFGRGQVRGGRVMANGDHRIAMAFLTLGLASREGIEVDGQDMIATSFPSFVAVLRSLGADIR